MSGEVEVDRVRVAEVRQRFLVGAVAGVLWGGFCVDWMSNGEKAEEAEFLQGVLAQVQVFGICLVGWLVSTVVLVWLVERVIRGDEVHSLE